LYSSHCIQLEGDENKEQKEQEKTKQKKNDWKNEIILKACMSVIQLFKEHPNTYKREVLGTLTEKQLNFLIDNLDEDFEEDEEYLLFPDMIHSLKEQGADTDLITMLEKALGGARDGIDICYTIE
jgi:hypothetical protein